MSPLRKGHTWIYGAAGVAVLAAGIGLYSMSTDDRGSQLAVCSSGDEESPERAEGVNFWCVTLGDASRDGGQLSVLVASTNAVDPLDVEHVVFYHPGGPGLSPVDALYQSGLPLALKSAAFVAVDGATAGVVRGYCGINDQDYHLDRPVPVGWEEDVAAANEDCKQSVLPIDGLTDAAEWEFVRSSLGIESIEILAHSYGTAVAQSYLHQFGDRVHRAVLDGAVANDVGSTARVAAVGAAIERAWESLSSACTPVTCSATLAQLLDGGRYAELRSAVLNRAPLVGQGDELSAVALDTASLAALRAQDLWPGYFAALDQALIGDGSALFRFAEASAIGLDRTRYYQGFCATISIGPGPLPTMAADEFLLVAFVSELYRCAGFPPSVEYLATMSSVLDQDLVRSVAVFGSRFDTLTPFELVSVSPDLRDARLCETDVVGHTSFPSAEVRAAMTEFLQFGRLSASAPCI